MWWSKPFCTPPETPRLYKNLLSPSFCHEKAGILLPRKEVACCPLSTMWLEHVQKVRDVAELMGTCGGRTTYLAERERRMQSGKRKQNWEKKNKVKINLVIFWRLLFTLGILYTFSLCNTLDHMCDSERKCEQVGVHGQLTTESVISCTDIKWWQYSTFVNMALVNWEF